MEVGNNTILRRTQKRKLSAICEEEEEEEEEEEMSRFPLNDLNQDLLERVLSWLPTSSFFRLTSVSKRWKSAADSATFKLACSQVPSRQPWFFMVDSLPHRSRQPIIFDSSEANWKKLSNMEASSDSIPVAAAGGLLCFLRPDGGFIITNPLNSSRREVKSPFSDSPIRAIAMTSNTEGFNLIIVSGDLPNLKFRRYNSNTDRWGEDTTVTRKTEIAAELEKNNDDDECTQYFLSKCGNVVSTDIQRSPSKQYSSILTREDGEDVLYFLSSSGTVVSCNLTRRVFFEYPRLLTVFSEYSIDLVECEGKMYVVLLSEFLETASLRVWTWDKVGRFWNQVAAAAPFMSHRFYGKKVDVNCAGAGGEMLVCVNSAEVCSYLMCKLEENEWVELPECCINGGTEEFVCAFSFEPRIEADPMGRNLL